MLMRAKKRPKMTAERYLHEIVDPTVQEFESEPTSVRRAMIACIVAFHAIEYFDPPLSRQRIMRESSDFLLVDRVVHATKHAATGPRDKPHLRSEEVIIRTPGVFGAAVLGLSGLDDLLGGVTVAKETFVDILSAVRRVAALLRSKLTARVLE